MAAEKSNYNFNVRTLWGIAKGKELAMSDEELYALVTGETGKTSISKLNQKELNRVCQSLLERKDLVSGKDTMQKKRTDNGGNSATIPLRRKMYALCGELGWNNDNNRIRAFAKKITGVSALEWLTAAQCNKVIEALKDMIKRGEDSAGMG